MKPTAWYDPTNGTVSTDKDSPLFTPLGQVLPLYTQRTWVGLTDEEMLTLEETTTCTKDESWLRNLTQAIEAKLKEKNT